jgi:hypothetical protein
MFFVDRPDVADAKIWLGKFSILRAFFSISSLALLRTRKEQVEGGKKKKKKKTEKERKRENSE